MGLLGKYAAFRWVTGGRGGGGGSSGSGLVLIFAVIVGIIGVIWAIFSVFSFVWNLIYGIVRPILMVFPPVTIPLAVALLGWPFTWLSPYSTEKTDAFLNGTEDNLSFGPYAFWAVSSVNVMFLTGAYDAFPEPNSLIEMVIGLVVALLLLYGAYELFHFPYRSFKLLLHSPRGPFYVIALLSPMSAGLITSAFNVSLNITLPLPDLLGSELAVIIGSLVFLNMTYLGGALAVLWKKDEIRTQATAAKQNDTRTGTTSKATISQEPNSNTD